MGRCPKFTVAKSLFITPEMHEVFKDLSKQTRIPAATIMRECLYRGLKVIYNRDVDDMED